MTFKPMLATQWNDAKQYEWPMIIQPKYDGVRAIWDGKVLWSRSGKPIDVPHIAKALGKFNLGANLILDGEIIHPTKDFNSSSGIVRKHAENDILNDKNELVFVIYDGIIGDEGFHTRNEWLKSKFIYYDKDNPQTITLSHSRIIEESDKDNFHKMFITAGYEGSIYRTLDGLYENKRSKGLIKRKERKYVWAKPVKLYEGKGKYIGTLGTIWVVAKIGNNYTNFKVGSGLTDVQRDEIWSAELNYDILIAYQELSLNGIPRFPVIKEIKWLATPGESKC